MAAHLDNYYSTVTRSQFVKCQKHPSFDLIYVCIDSSCFKKGVKCKECLSEEHIGHKTMLLTDFITSMKCLYTEQEEQFAQTCRVNKLRLDRDFDAFVNKLKVIILELEQKSKEIIANLKIDLRYFWKALDDNPPFVYKKYLEKLDSNSVHSQKLLSEMITQLLYYYQRKGDLHTYKQIINNSFDEAFNTFQFNLEKTHQLSRKMLGDLSNLIIERLKKPEASPEEFSHKLLEPKTYEEKRKISLIKSRFDTEDSLLGRSDSQLVFSTNMQDSYFEHRETIYPDENRLSKNSSIVPMLRVIPFHKKKDLSLARSYKIHSSCIWKIIHFNDNETFASAGEDNIINIYNYRANRSVQKLISHKGSVNDLVYLTGTNRFVSTSSDTTVKIWSERTGLLLKSLKDHDDWVQPAIYFDHTQYLCTGGGDGIRVWDVEKACSIQDLREHEKGVLGMASLDGFTFASCSFDSGVKLWDVRVKKSTASFTHDGNHFNRLCYLQDDESFAASCADGKIKIFSLKNLKTLFNLRGHLNGCIPLNYVNDGENFLSGGEDRSVKVWNFKKGECVKTYEGLHSLGIQSICYLDDGNSILTGSLDKTINHWTIL